MNIDVRGEKCAAEIKTGLDWAVSTFCSDIDHLDMKVCVLCF